MIATALDVITAALLKLRVHRAGAAVPPEDAQDALDVLNLILEEWVVDGRMVFRVLEMTHPLVGAQANITIGPGGMVNTVRPLALHDSFTRVGTLDFPYRVIPVEEYSGIHMKALTEGWPHVLYYEPAYPMGIIHPWPVPSGGYELHLQMDAPFMPFGSVLDLVSLPPGYTNALIFELAEQRSEDYGQTLSPIFLMQMQRAKAALARRNHRPVYADLPVPWAHRGHDPAWILTGGM